MNSIKVYFDFTFKMFIEKIHLIVHYEVELNDPKHVGKSKVETLIY